MASAVNFLKNEPGLILGVLHRFGMINIGGLEIIDGCICDRCHPGKQECVEAIQSTARRFGDPFGILRAQVIFPCGRTRPLHQRTIGILSWAAQEYTQAAFDSWAGKLLPPIPAYAAKLNFLRPMPPKLWTRAAESVMGSSRE